MGLLDLPPGTAILGWPEADDAHPVTRGKGSLVICLILAVICFVVLSARMVARLFKERTFGADDGIMMAAWLPTLALVANSYLAITSYDFDRHLWDIKTSNYPSMLKITFADEFLYTLASSLIKLSILTSLLRLNSGSISNFYKKIIYGSIAFVVCHILIFGSEMFLSCMPFEETFKVYAANADRTCVNGGVWPNVRNVLSLVQDFIPAVLAVVLSARMDFHGYQKLAVVSILTFGFIVCFVGVVRVGYFSSIYFTTWDWSWLGGQAFLFSTIECLLGMTCASLPALTIYLHPTSPIHLKETPHHHPQDSLTFREPLWRKLSMNESGRKLSMNESGRKLSVVEDVPTPGHDDDDDKRGREGWYKLKETGSVDSLLWKANGGAGGNGNGSGIGGGNANVSSRPLLYGGRRRSRVASMANIFVEGE